MSLARKITAAFLSAALWLTSCPQVSAHSGAEFVHAQGTRIIGTDGQPLIIKGVSFGNNIWDNPALPTDTHHGEEQYRELAEMGFNSVRFFLNYGLFEDDDNPYEYRQSGFDWLDKNIEWAEKYGIGLILNMHYPQGGYQSQGDGTCLWTDAENRNRLTKLWAAIAEHCADEPTVWGYGLINEPYLPLIGNRQNTISFYRNYMRELAAEVRRAAPEQIIFVERMCNIRGYAWNELNLYADIAYPLIEGDDNIVYEFHFYDPFKLTHSETAGGINPPKYPLVDIDNSTFESTWVGAFSAEEKSHSNGWSYFETKPVYATGEYNVGALAVNAGGTSDGAAYFDDLKVTEISAEGSRVIAEYRFSSADEIKLFSKWTADGSGTLEYSEDGRFGGCCKVSGTDMDLTGGTERFILEEGKQYVVSGYVRVTGNVRYARPRLDYCKVSEFLYVDKSYLEQRIMENVEFSEKHNVPLYLGEFGCCTDSFDDGVSALTWVEDMIDICYKHNIGFNYHAYHEPMFGLHMSNSSESLPTEADLNTELAALFGRKLKTQAPTPGTNSADITAMLKKLLPFI